MSEAEIDGDPEARRAAWLQHGFYFPTKTPMRVVPHNTGLMTEREHEVMLTLISRNKFADPFSTFVRHTVASTRADLFNPDPSISLVESQIACEILLDGLLLMLAWESNTEPAVAAQWFDQPLTLRVRTRFASFLGGAWDTTKERTAVGTWAKHVRDVRIE